MPTPIKRDSLLTTLESRYKNQRVGGAYDAKTAGTVPDFEKSQFADEGKIGGKDTGMPKKESMYVKGLDTTKYKG